MPFPQSLLARTVLMIGGLLLVSQLGLLALFSLYEREPRARGVAQRAVAMVNLTRAALLAAQPDKRRALLRELSQREGVHILPVEEDEAEPPPPANRLQALVAEGIRRELGEETQIGFGDDQGEGVWIAMLIEQDAYWLVLPSAPSASGIPLYWAAWGMGVLLLSLTGGALLARRVNRPLLQVAEAARRIGRGEKPPSLKEEGAQEISALARAFNQMSDEITALESNRKLMLAGISHDLRTPMTRLRLALEMNVSDSGERQAMVADLDDMETLARQFMDFAREDSDELPVETDLDALVGEVVGCVNVELAKRACVPQIRTSAFHHCPFSLREKVGMRVEPWERARREGNGQNMRIQGHVGACLLRPQVMRRALRNLLENALKHGAPPVEIGLSREAGEWVVTVCDHGAGLPETELESIKHPFRRGEAARTGAQGSGLGLAIAERAAHLHGGRLVLLNQLGGGLEVQLSGKA